jgi:FkbM family methyltransferase
MINYNIHTTDTNIKYLLGDTADIITNEVRQLGSFEDHVITIAKRMLANVKDPYILDIGANIGTFSIPLGLHFPNSIIKCFEVQQRVYYQLCSNILLNNLTNVNAHWCGVTDETKSELIDVLNESQSQNYGAYTLDKNIRIVNPQNNVYSSNQILTQLIKLDDVKLVKPPSLIKIDVEGLELQVLTGGKQLFSKYKPILILECWGNSWFRKQHSAVFQMLDSLNYKMINEYGDNKIFI